MFEINWFSIEDLDLELYFLVEPLISGQTYSLMGIKHLWFSK